MDYLNTLITKTASIHNAIKLIKQLPACHWLTNMYKRSFKNKLMFISAAIFFTLYNTSSYIKTKRQILNSLPPPPIIPFDLPFGDHTL